MLLIGYFLLDHVTYSFTTACDCTKLKVLLCCEHNLFSEILFSFLFTGYWSWERKILCCQFSSQRWNWWWILWTNFQSCKLMVLFFSVYIAILHLFFTVFTLLKNVNLFMNIESPLLHDVIKFMLFWFCYSQWLQTVKLLLGVVYSCSRNDVFVWKNN